MAPDLGPYAVLDRRARRLVGSEFASVVGDFMTLAAMPFAVASIGGSGQQIAFALAAQAGAVALTLPLGGVIGDRLPRRTVLVGADVLRAVSQGAVAVLLLTGDAGYWQLIVAQVVHGTGTGVFMPSSTAIVPDVLTPGLVQPTNGLKQVGRAVAGIVGPALGAAAVAAEGPGLALGVDAATFAVSAAFLIGLPASAHGVRVARSITRELRDGWLEFRRRRWLRSVTVQFTLVNALVIAPFFVLGPVMAQEFFGGAGAWALILMGLAAGEFAGGGAAMSWRPGRPLVAGATVFTLWAVPLVLLATQAPLPLIVAGAVMAGSAQAIFAVLWETTVQTQIAAAQRSRLSSFEQFGSLVFVPAGFVAGGWLAETVGASQGLLGSAVLLLLASAVVLMLPSVRGVRAYSTREGDSKRESQAGVVAPAFSSGDDGR